MTFSPDFAFYRDDRALGGPPDDAFWDAMKAEAGIEMDRRRDTYPKLVAKGRLSRVDADRELRVWCAIAEDWGAAQRSPGFPIATWTEMAHCLRREIALRRKFYPGWVEAGRIDAAEAEARLLLVETWHDLLWHCNHPEAVAARAAVGRLRSERAIAHAA